jgi:ATP/maltotriose-dependent transcriptional regulator MalT
MPDVRGAREHYFHASVGAEGIRSTLDAESPRRWHAFLVVARPLRGRQAETDRLMDAISATAAGAGGIVLFEGPAGIGKTALLDDTRELAAARGFVVCCGVCDELDQMTPLTPLLTALRSSTPPLVDRTAERPLRSSG